MGQLRASGFAVVEDALPVALLAELDAQCHRAATEFAPSGVGTGAAHLRERTVRGDVISWLDPERTVDHRYLDVMESLRVSLNQQLFLGLFHYECHYAIYETGARYERHLDSLAGRTNRLLSTVVYLNPTWSVEDGGELLLYRGADSRTPVMRVLPQPGLMVLFLSEEFPHEVLPAIRSRHSIAGWFRGRARS